MNLLFDFDGTLADSYPLNAQIMLELAPKYHLRVNSAPDDEAMRELSIKQIFEQSGLAFWQLPFFLKDSQALVETRMNQVKAFEGLIPVLKTLAAQGHRLGIVTSNTVKNVELFLTQNMLMEIFEFVHSEKNIWGKAAAFKNVLKTQNLNLAETIYFGDETRDIEAAHQAGMRIISVGWGFNSPKFLRTAQPDFLVETPSEILPLIAGLN